LPAAKWLLSRKNTLAASTHQADHFVDNDRRFAASIVSIVAESGLNE
jgi:hypothetical protein